MGLLKCHSLELRLQEEGVSVEAITKVKDAGNVAYKANTPESWAVAVKKYTKALRYVEHKRDGSDVVGDKGAPGGDVAKELANLEATCYLNRAQVFLKLDNKKGAYADTSAVLKLQGVSAAQMVKAYYRRSQATNDEESKEEDLRAVIKLDPSNGPAKRDLDALKKKNAAKLEAQRKAYSKMFS